MFFDTNPTTQDALSIFVANYNEGKAPEVQLNDTDWLYDLPARILDDPVNPKTATMIRARPTGGSGLQGRVSIYGHRIDLDNFADFSVRSNATTVLALLPAINHRLGILLVEDDVVDGPVVPGEMLALPVKATSYMFVGQLNIQVNPA